MDKVSIMLEELGLKYNVHKIDYQKVSKEKAGFRDEP